MTRLRLFAVAVGLALLGACAGGLLLDSGNEFVCDPVAATSRGTQDPQCPEGWACGVNRRCAKFEPDEVDSASLQLLNPPERVFPLPGLDGPYTDVAGPSADKPLAAVLPVNAGEGTLVDLEKGIIQRFSLPDLAGQQLFEAAFTGDAVAAIIGSGGQRFAFIGTGAGSGARQVELPDGGPLRDAFSLRGLFTADGGSNSAVLYVQRFGRPDGGANGAGAVIPRPGPLTPIFDEFVLTSSDGGVYGTALSDGGFSPAVALDARPVPRHAILRSDRRTDGCTLPVSSAEKVVPVAVAKQGLFVRACRGLGSAPDDWLALVGEEEAPLLLSTAGEPPKLRTDAAYDLYALAFGLDRTPGRPGRLRHDTLSVWRLNRASGTPTVQRAWQDCAPCGDGRIVTFAPTLTNGVSAVDVACEPSLSESLVNASVRIVRVTGSAGSAPEESCAFSPVTPSVDTREIGGRTVSVPSGGTRTHFPIADYVGSGLIIGGKHGQLWRGSSFENLRPLFLDRVPEAISSLAGRPFALTENYASYQLIDGGLVVIPDEALADVAGVPVRPRSAPGDAKNQNLGWVVLEGADLARISYDGGTFTTANQGGVRVQFGSPMIDAAAARPPPPYFVDLVLLPVPADGGTPGQTKLEEHFVITAFDSVYVSSKALTSERDVLTELVPELTPQPGAIIRSLAIDRSIKDNTAVQAQGHLIAGRTLFRIQLRDDGKDTQRWVADEVLIGGGEPVQVFMRSPTDDTGVARIAFRDGRILTLPAGVELVGALPGRALSFATLGAVPVALTEEGLYTPQLGFRENTDPPELNSSYSWVRSALPAELESLPPVVRRERMKTAKLQVLNEASGEVLYLFTDFGFVYKVATAPRR